MTSPLIRVQLPPSSSFSRFCFHLSNPTAFETHKKGMVADVQIPSVYCFLFIFFFCLLCWLRCEALVLHNTPPPAPLTVLQRG